MTGAESLLCTVLDCGEVDLQMLDDVNLDWDEVIDETRSRFSELSFNNVLAAVILIGIDKAFWIPILERKEELVKLMRERRLDESEDEEYRGIMSFRPNEDIGMFLNYLDTHVYFKSMQTRELYEEVLGSQPFEDFYELTGFEIEK